MDPATGSILASMYATQDGLASLCLDLLSSGSGDKMLDWAACDTSCQNTTTNGDLIVSVGEFLLGKVFRLMDGCGRVLMSGTLGDSNQLIHTSELSSGTYYLTIVSSGAVKRIVKQ
jgi:hypothetical protein